MDHTYSDRDILEALHYFTNADELNPSEAVEVPAVTAQEHTAEGSSQRGSHPSQQLGFRGLLYGADSIAHGARSEGLTRTTASSAHAESKDDPPRGVGPTEKPTKKRRLDELKQLRSSAVSLELRLSELEEEKSSRSQSHDTRRSTQGMWQRIAQLQYDERKKALSENARLKGAIEEHLKLAKSLERVIRKQPQLLFSLDAEGANDPPPPSNQQRIELLEQIEETYRCLNQEVQRSILNDTPHDWSNVSTQDTSNVRCKAIRVHLQEARTFPSSVKAIADAMWACFLSTKSSDQGVAKVVEVSGNSLSGCFETSLSVGMTSISMRCITALKRYDEENHVVFVWTSKSTCESTPFQEMEYQCNENGWCKIETLPSASSTTGITRLSTIFTPSHREDPTQRLSCANLDISSFTQLVLSTYKSALQFVYSETENALMKELVAQRTV